MEELSLGMEELLPDLSGLDLFLQEALQSRQISTMDFIEDVLEGGWVMEPLLIVRYVQSVLLGYWDEWRRLFVTLLVLFILASVVISFLNAFQNAAAAQAAQFFFVLCQLVLLIAALREIMEIAADAMSRMTEFLKIALPAFMICVATAGSGLTAAIFYKLLLGFVCLIEGLVVVGLLPVVEGYMLLGVVESLFGEERFKGLMDLIKKGILWVLRGMVVLLSGSGILQMIITPVLDKANMTFMRKTASAIPGIGDLAESVTSVTVAAASAIKSSFGVVILLFLLLLMAAPVLKILLLLAALRLGGALGSIGGERRMLVCNEHMTEAGFLILRMLVTVTTLFFVTIAVLTNLTSMT